MPLYAGPKSRGREKTSQPPTAPGMASVTLDRDELELIFSYEGTLI